MGLKDRAHKIYSVCPFLEYDEFMKNVFSLRTEAHELIKLKYKEEMEKERYKCLEEFPIVYYREGKVEDHGRVDLLCIKGNEIKLIEVKSYSEHFAKIDDLYQLITYMISLSRMINDFSKNSASSSSVESVANRSKRAGEQLTKLSEFLEEIKELGIERLKIVGELVVNDNNAPKRLITIDSNSIPSILEPEKSDTLQPGHYCRFCKHYDIERGICILAYRDHNLSTNEGKQ